MGLDRDRLFRIYRRAGKKDSTVYQRAVIKYRAFNVLVIKGKMNFITEQLTLCKGNQTKFSQVINGLIGAKEIGTVIKPGSHSVPEYNESD